MPPILAWSMTSVRRTACGRSGWLRWKPSAAGSASTTRWRGTWLASRPVGVFAAAVSGHHGGLPAGADLKNELGAADTDVQAGWAAAIEEAAAFVPEVTPAAPPSLPA